MRRLLQTFLRMILVNRRQHVISLLNFSIILRKDWNGKFLIYLCCPQTIVNFLRIKITKKLLPFELVKMWLIEDSFWNHFLLWWKTELKKMLRILVVKCIASSWAFVWNTKRIIVLRGLASPLPILLQNKMTCLKLASADVLTCRKLAPGWGIFLHLNKRTPTIMTFLFCTVTQMDWYFSLLLLLFQRGFNWFTCWRPDGKLVTEYSQWNKYSL